MREIIDVLGMLVSADEASDEVQDWGLYFTAGGPVWTGGSNWPDDVAVASTAEIDEMADRRLLRITGYPSDEGRQFAVTAGGRQAWLDHVEANSPERAVGGPATLEWDRTRTLLRMLYQAYVDRGAPRRGVDSLTLIAGLNDPHSARAQLEGLVRGGYWSRPGRNGASGWSAPPLGRSRCSRAGPPAALKTLCRPLSLR